RKTFKEVIVYTYTLYCRKYWPRPPNHVIQVFQSPPWSQACRRLLQTLVKEWVVVRSSVTPSVWSRDRLSPVQ
ncbi:unnamed protein product, partial [Staurois parvus]